MSVDRVSLRKDDRAGDSPACDARGSWGRWGSTCRASGAVALVVMLALGAMAIVNAA